MKVLKQPEKKTYERDAQLTRTVLDIIDNVRAKGDEALIEYAAKFDKMEIETVRVDPADVIIIEGILVFNCKELRDQMDVKIFVDADDDDRLMRVMARDITERGKDVRWVIERYSRTVKPMYLQFIEPSKRYADIIIPQGGHNKVAIDIIINTIEKSLKEQKNERQ